MRIVFMGSPDFAVPTLRALVDVHDVVSVVSQPDKPSGRGQKLQPPAVKLAALDLGLPVLQPSSAKADSFHESLKLLKPDAAVVVAYGKILPQKILDVPKQGCFNVHGSILPRWRGAAPIQRAVLAGDEETGVTIMRLDAGMDTGPTCLIGRIRIEDDDTAGTLHDKLSVLGAGLMVQALGALEKGRLPFTPQDGTRATHAAMLEKSDGFVDWNQPARAVRDRIRAVDPWPGAYTLLEGAPLKMWKPVLVEGRGTPGTVLGEDMHGLAVACGDGAVALGELQLPGRKRMGARALLGGRPMPAGTRLGS